MRLRSFQGLALLLGWLLAACSTPEDRRQLEQERFAREVTDEKAVGRMMAAKLAGHFGYDYSDEALIKYLNLVGQTIAARGNRSELAFRFGILKSEEINAFATPAGYVFVTIPLLREVRSESELAGILAHEVAHVTERHMYKEIAPKRDVSAGETLTRILSRGGSDLGLSIGKVVNSGMEMLLEKGLGEEKESAADQAGVLLAASAGYDPMALLDFLSRLQTRAASVAAVKLSKTHPPFPKRIRELSEFVEKNGLRSAGKAEAQERQHRFEQATQSLRAKNGGAS
jgi:predicted Zn-dependent protease